MFCRGNKKEFFDFSISFGEDKAKVTNKIIAVCTTENKSSWCSDDCDD